MVETNNISPSFISSALLAVWIFTKNLRKTARRKVGDLK